MLNRNSKYVSYSKEEIKKVEERVKGKRVKLLVAGGILVTAMLMTGCGKHESQQTVGGVSTSKTDVFVLYNDVNQVDFNSFNVGIEYLKIEGTNLTNVEELANYPKLETVKLEDNLLTDVSPLEGLSELTNLDISNNSIFEFNIENYESLNHLDIAGNFNLYTEDMVNYCKEHNIALDITQEDVKDVDEIKTMLASLDLDGKTDIEKEKIIAKFVIDHLKYDKSEDMIYAYSLDALGYAIDGKGVCINYATLFNAMCQLSGITSYQLVGISNGGGHAWNLVEIDGQYMLCDITWMDQKAMISNLVNKEAFLNQAGKNAKRFLKTHGEGPIISPEVEDFVATNVRSNMTLHDNLEEEIDKITVEKYANQLVKTMEYEQSDANDQTITGGRIKG